MADTPCEHFSREEVQLFALYARYPDLSFESDRLSGESETASIMSTKQDTIANSLNVSSALSTSEFSISSTDDRSKVEVSRSPRKPAHRVYQRVEGPLMSTGQRLMRSGAVTDEGTLEYYSQLVAENGECPEMRELLTQISTALANIGQDLFPVDVKRPLPHIDNIYDRCKIVLRDLIKANLEVIKQREKIACLKRLRAFNLDPTNEYVWTVYQQRVELIFSHTSCPTQREQDLIDALVVLFHVQLYGPFMDFIEHEELEQRFKKIFGAMFEKIAGWSSLYGRWWSDMVELNQNYTVPLLRRIYASAEIQEEIREQHLRKQAADVDCDVASLSLDG